MDEANKDECITVACLVLSKIPGTADVELHFIYDDPNVVGRMLIMGQDIVRNEIKQERLRSKNDSIRNN